MRNFLPSPALSKEEARMKSPLEMAYLGDTIYDLFVRRMLLERGLNVRAAHKEAVKLVNARAQAGFAQRLAGLLEEEETLIYKRGRNAHPHHAAPKAASVAEYAEATGLEALCGYLYLTGNLGRLNELLQLLEKGE